MHETLLIRPRLPVDLISGVQQNVFSYVEIYIVEKKKINKNSVWSIRSCENIMSPQAKQRTDQNWEMLECIETLPNKQVGSKVQSTKNVSEWKRFSSVG